MTIDGVSVRMEGQDWIIPPLTLGQLRRLWPQVQQLTEIGAAMGAGEIAVIVEIVTAALQRAYPDMTPERVAELLDLGNAGKVLNAVLTGSGLGPGEAAPAAVLTVVSAGSTASLPPAADTPSP